LNRLVSPLTNNLFNTIFYRFTDIKDSLSCTNMIFPIQGAKWQDQALTGSGAIQNHLNNIQEIAEKLFESGDLTEGEEERVHYLVQQSKDMVRQVKPNDTDVIVSNNGRMFRLGDRGDAPSTLGTLERCSDPAKEGTTYVDQCGKEVDVIFYKVMPKCVKSGGINTISPRTLRRKYMDSVEDPAPDRDGKKDKRKVELLKGPCELRDMCEKYNLLDTPVSDVSTMHRGYSWSPEFVSYGAESYESPPSKRQKRSEEEEDGMERDDECVKTICF
jgi:hypothetical protein